jgi:hypothetical protein
MSVSALIMGIVVFHFSVARTHLPPPMRVVASLAARHGAPTLATFRTGIGSPDWTTFRVL